MKALVLASLLALNGTCQAMDMCDSGSWYHPYSDGQGLSVEISEELHSDKPDVVVYYYTYDSGGWPIFFVGTGNRDNYYTETVDLEFISTGGMTPPFFQEEVSINPGGSGSLTFRPDGKMDFKFSTDGEYWPVFYGFNGTHTWKGMIKLFNICGED